MGGEKEEKEVKGDRERQRKGKLERQKVEKGKESTAGDHPSSVRQSAATTRDLP